MSFSIRLNDGRLLSLFIYLLTFTNRHNVSFRECNKAAKRSNCLDRTKSFRTTMVPVNISNSTLVKIHREVGLNFPFYFKILTISPIRYWIFCVPSIGLFIAFPFVVHLQQIFGLCSF